MPAKKRLPKTKVTEVYQHPEVDVPMRPEVGIRPPAKSLFLSADAIPAWFLDTNYNGLCFHVSQAFFARTGAWENLNKALRGDYEETVWDHLAGTVSAPFAAGEHGQIAVKVIEQRGNELLVVKGFKEAN